MPLEAICYAGKWLDREIPEFETLVVEGRGGFERQINAPERVGDGSLYLNSRIKERKITVTSQFFSTVFAMSTRPCARVETPKVLFDRMTQPSCNSLTTR